MYKLRPRILFSQTTRYESIFTRLRKYLRPAHPPPTNFMKDIQSRAAKNLSEHAPFQFPSNDLKPNDRVPINALEEKLMIIENEKQHSEIEKLQMKEIDKFLGTNTYFHETAANEERINSEFVMQRKFLTKANDGQQFLSLMASQDPQEEIINPKIRNFSQFVKEAQSLKSYPSHPKENKVIKTDYDSSNDFYDYLNFQDLSKEMMVDKLNNMDKNVAFKKYMEFSGQELMYMEYSLLKNTKMETQMSKEYFRSLDVHSMKPLYYQNWIYFSKDPKTSTNSINDIFRIKVQNKQNEESLMDVLDKSEGEQVVTADEILDFLSAKFALNEEIFDWVYEFKNDKNTHLYYDFFFDKKHETMVIILKISNTFLTIFKDLKTNKINEKVLLGVDDILIDDKNGIYFVKENDLGRNSFLVYWNLNDQEDKEICVYEEKDLNYDLKIQRISNSNYGLLICEHLIGDKTNEIGILDLSNREIPIKRILKRDLKNNWKLNFNEEYFYFKKKNEQKIYQLAINPLKNTKIPLLLHESTSKESKELDLASNKIKIIDSSKQNLLVMQENFLIESFSNEQHYDILYQAEKNERILDFEVFNHYVIIHLKNQELKEYFKVYNCRTKGFHSLLINEPLYKLEKSEVQRHESQFFNFTIKSLHHPDRLMSYNMAMRDLKPLHVDHYKDYSLDDYTIEHVDAEMRDNTNIPITFIYNKKKVHSNSSLILFFEDPIKIEFKPEMLPVFERGFILAIPHLRGSRHLNEEWTQKGSNLRKLTMITDYIDSASFILKNEIAKRVFAFGKGHIGGFTTICSVLREPKIFSGSVIDNGIFNILEYVDLKRNDSEILKLYGSLLDKDLYFLLKGINPYNLDKVTLANLMVTCDVENSMAYQSRKFIAKCRENKTNKDIYFREFGYGNILNEKFFKQAAFIIDIAYRS